MHRLNLLVAIRFTVIVVLPKEALLIKVPRVTPVVPLQLTHGPKVAISTKEPARPRPTPLRLVPTLSV